jgi:hypothetical protein
MEVILMTDSDVVGRINQLAHEEHVLWERESTGETTEANRLRLKEIQISLDQWWDYLNQRRALRDARRNPDQAQVRDAATIGRYLG